MICFTTVDMVVWDTLTMDRLLSVYQGNANAVSDEGTVQKEYKTCYSPSHREDPKHHGHHSTQAQNEYIAAKHTSDVR